ncbi:MAG: hypothetical protein KF841_13725 [Phycisphaerae bacterium]|nr:hypothetical protein [Phycisphaerae bacterium]
MSERFDLNRLLTDPDLVARIASAEELFGFFTREIQVPASCIALGYGKSRQPALMTGGQTVDADHAAEILFVRSVPFQLEYAIGNLPSSDGFSFGAIVKLSVQVMPERIDLEAFRQAVVGSRRIVNVDRLHQHCAAAVHAATEKFVRARAASDLVSSATWKEFDDELAELFKPLGFDSGLALGRDPRITLHSAAYEETRQESRAAALRAERDREEHARREAAAGAREARFEEIKAMVAKLESVAGASGAFHVADVIRYFDVAQRGQLYQGLMASHVSANPARYILLVAGGDLVWFEPSNIQVPARKQSLPDDVGALRSVRIAETAGQRSIVVGARNGVHVLNEIGEHVRTFRFVPSESLRGGVNAATLTPKDVFATHSEVGLLHWAIDHPDAMKLCLTDFTEGSRAVRDVQTDDAGRIWLAVDNLSIGWRPGDESPAFVFAAPSEITSLIIADHHAIAGLRDGAVVRWLIGDSRPDMQTLRSAMGKPVQSLEWHAGGGIPRLLIGDGRPHLDLLVLGDSITAQFRSMHELRWGFASDDLIVAVNDRRDHLIVWSPANPEMPRGAVAVRRLIGRSIQDVAILS